MGMRHRPAKPPVRHGQGWNRGGPPPGPPRTPTAPQGARGASAPGSSCSAARPVVDRIARRARQRGSSGHRADGAHRRRDNPSRSSRRRRALLVDDYGEGARTPGASSPAAAEQAGLADRSQSAPETCPDQRVPGTLFQHLSPRNGDAPRSASSASSASSPDSGMNRWGSSSTTGYGAHSPESGMNSKATKGRVPKRSAPFSVFRASRQVLARRRDAVAARAYPGDSSPMPRRPPRRAHRDQRNQRLTEQAGSESG